MSFAISVHKLFWTDVAEARNYCEAISATIADKFEKAFNDAYQNIHRNPEAYFNLSKRIRRIQIAGFPYQIIYSVRKNFIYILCLHPSHSGKKEWNKRSKG